MRHCVLSACVYTLQLDDGLASRLLKLMLVGDLLILFCKYLWLSFNKAKRLYKFVEFYITILVDVHRPRHLVGSIIIQDVGAKVAVESLYSERCTHIGKAAVESLYSERCTRIGKAAVESLYSERCTRIGSAQNQ